MIVHDRLNILKRFIKSAGVEKLLRQLWRRYTYRLRGLPVVLQIEPTEACNLKCPYCVSSQKMLGTKTMLQFDEFKQILDDVMSIKNYYPNIILFWRGEPFLNPDACRMIQYASQKNLHITTSTNGTLLNANMREELLASGLDILVVSFDGGTKETYEQSRVGAHFEQVIEQVTQFCKERNARSLKKPFVEIQYILTQQTEAEIEQIQALSQQMGVDNLRFKTLNLVHFARADMSSQELIETAREYLPHTTSFSRYTIENGEISIKSVPRHCAWEHGLVLASDGEIRVCCVDNFGQYSPGNVLQEGFWTVWNRPENKALRQKVGNRQLTMCKICS